MLGYIKTTQISFGAQPFIEIVREEATKHIGRSVFHIGESFKKHPPAAILSADASVKHINNAMITNKATFHIYSSFILMLCD